MGKGAQDREVQDATAGREQAWQVFLSGGLVFCFLRRRVRGGFGVPLGFGIWTIFLLCTVLAGSVCPPACCGFMRVQTC